MCVKTWCNYTWFELRLVWTYFEIGYSTVFSVYKLWECLNECINKMDMCRLISVTQPINSYFYAIILTNIFCFILTMSSFAIYRIGYLYELIWKSCYHKLWYLIRVPTDRHHAKGVLFYLLLLYVSRVFLSSTCRCMTNVVWVVVCIFVYFAWEVGV